MCRAFIISILAMMSIGLQNYLFSSSATSLSYKLRSLSLRAILRQDSKSVSEYRTALSHDLFQLSTLTEMNIVCVQWRLQ